MQTHKAKSNIKSALKDEKRKVAQKGKSILEKELKRIKISHENVNLQELQTYYKVPSELELFYQIALDKIDLSKLKEFEVRKGVLKPKRTIQKRVQRYFGQRKAVTTKPKKPILVIGDNMEKLDYTLANCCNPIPGD